MPRTRLLAAACLAVALASPVVPARAVTASGRLQIIQLDVGQGDGAVLISPLGQVVMIDDGVSGNPTPANGQKVLTQLQALGISHVDYHFASHYHSDHIGLFPTLNSGGVTFDYGWDRAQSYTTTVYTNYVNALGAKRRTLVKNQVITLDSLSAHPVTIKCVDLAGAGVSTSDENSLSVVLKVSYGAFDEVFGGDLQGSTGGSGADIESVVGPEVGPVEVYKVHHHGSRYSTNANWLAATQPKIGVISCGSGNTYGHPTADALGRLHTAGTHTYWTETGAGVTPDASWDKVSNGQVVISATWQAGGVDTIRGTGFADTFTNSGSAPGDVTPPVVALSSPDGGETWKEGSSHAITWSATDDNAVTSVDLDWSSDGGSSWVPVAAGQANTGTWAWTVPALATTRGRVRVRARDAAGNLGSDSSAANFAIDTWTVVASAGAGGIISPSGTLHVVEGLNLNFTIAPSAGYHVADVQVDGGSVGAVTAWGFPAVAANHTIAATFALDAFTVTVGTTGAGSVARLPNLASYPWGTAVSLTPTPADGWSFAGWTGDTTTGADPLALVVRRDRALTANFVDATAPFVQVTSPVGGERLLEGATVPVTWTASDNAGVDSVTVAYSLSGAGGPWLVIASGLANTGSTPWSLPLQASDSALVRVTAYDASANGASATSDSLFHIVDPSVGVGSGPAALALARPQPNPAIGRTTLRFSLPGAGSARLEIVDASGRRVWSEERDLPAGAHSIAWEGRDADGAPLHAGLYFVRLVTPWGTRTQHLAWLR